MQCGNRVVTSRYSNINNGTYDSLDNASEKEWGCLSSYYRHP